MIDQESLEVIADSFEQIARKELTTDGGIGFRICVFTDTHMYGMPAVDANSRSQKAFIGDMVRWFVRKYKGRAVALVSEAWVLTQKPEDNGDIDFDKVNPGKGSLGDNPNSVEAMIISVTSPIARVSRIKQFDRDEEGIPHNLRNLDQSQDVDLAKGNFADFFGDPDLNEEEKRIVQAEAKKVLRKGIRMDRSGLKFAAPKTVKFPSPLH